MRNSPDVTAIVLVGGRAMRMRPLSLGKDKCMISFMGRPLLLHLIKSLSFHGISDIILASRGRHGEIGDYFSDGSSLGVNIRYYQPGRKKFFGTAGAVRAIKDSFAGSVSDLLLVIYGDSLLDADYSSLLNSHAETGTSCTILYHRPDFGSFLYEGHDIANYDGEPRTNYGVMDVEMGGKITKVVEKEKIAKIATDYSNPVANAAVYVLEKRLLDLVPADRNFDFPRDLFPLLMEKDVSCRGFDVGDGYRMDIGTLQSYYSTQLAILRGGIRFEHCYPLVAPGVWMGENSTIGSAVQLSSPVSIGDNCAVGDKSRIENSVIGNNVAIGDGCIVRGSIVQDNVVLCSGSAISQSVIGEYTEIGVSVTLPPLTVLGAHCRVSCDAITPGS
jgi:mannose-1-phosphate guanylyltransferase / phosphomannomutase